MASSKEIRSRIKSIDNTGKITRAMEMVSAAKMRKSTENVLKIRDYAHSAWSVLNNLARAFEDYKHGMLEVRPVKSVLMIVMTSNRGLCGSFNSQIMKKVREEINNPRNLKMNRIGNKKIESKVEDKDLKIDFITVGKKGEGLVSKLGKEIVAAFPELTYLPKIEQVRPLSKIVIDEYLNKKYDKVVMAYTDYVSVIVQQPKIRQLLPISKIDLEKQIAEMDNIAKEYGLDKPKSEYKVEPNPDEVLEHIFPRLIEMQLYHAILESNASKESARMMAMRSATDSAKEMSESLNLAYNKIRQMKITQEIAEISAGRAALE
ncbi:MAG: ATP synthase F1 subunit gamma [Candidatus Moranbacteria bacterium]|jgi:F-type H+-transporting ATPase subunit gamma|nr:ATP synthase F1 subunit gamma [Candidatus Moranbacteria bacterium]